MSLQTWMDEYYPETAEAASSRHYDDGELSAGDLVEHALKKWRGLRPEILAKHGLKTSWNGVAEMSGEHVVAALPINAGTCALCIAFPPEIEFDDEGDDYVEVCPSCPLAKARGGVPCDQKRDDELASPFVTWTRQQNPEPMIMWLERAKEHCDE